MASTKSSRPLLVAAIAAIGVVAAAVAPKLLEKGSGEKAELATAYYSGRVLDAESKMAISGAKVQLELPLGSVLRFTDSEGVYRFDIPMNQTLRSAKIRVESEGFQVYEREISILAENRLEEIRLVVEASLGSPVSATDPTERYRDIAGEWRISDRIGESLYQRYVGMEIEFSVFMTVAGTRVQGLGEKQNVNGKAVSPAERSVLEIEGTLNGYTMKALFKETGSARTSTGTFTWNFGRDFRSFEGTFESSVGSTKGLSTGFREDLASPANVTSKPRIRQARQGVHYQGLVLYPGIAIDFLKSKLGPEHEFYHEGDNAVLVWLTPDVRLTARLDKSGTLLDITVSTVGSEELGESIYAIVQGKTIPVGQMTLGEAIALFPGKAIRTFEGEGFDIGEYRIEFGPEGLWVLEISSSLPWNSEGSNPRVAFETATIGTLSIRMR